MKKYLFLLLFAAGVLFTAGCGKDEPAPVSAEAVCHCDYYFNGTTNFTVGIFVGKRKDDGSFRRAGELLTLDFIAAGNVARDVLPEGTFTLDTDGDPQPGELIVSKSFTLREYLQRWIDAGVNIDFSDYSSLDLDAIAGYNGTTYYSQTNARNGESVPVTKASMTITRNGSNYLISASVTAGEADYEFVYDGPLTVVVKEPSKPLTQGVTAIYYGDYYKIKADCWALRVNLPENEAIFLEIIKEQATIDGIPEGEFSCSAALEPGTLIRGHINGGSGMVEGSCVGNWSGNISTLIDEGSVTITPSADHTTCRVDYSLRGNSPSFGGDIEGTFTGALDIVDGTPTATTDCILTPILNLKNIPYYGSKKALP